MSLNSWILAARPKTLTAALVPVIVATSLAFRLSGTLRLDIVVLALLVAVFIQIGTNLVNDALDFKKGADTKERVGPLRVTESGILKADQVLRASIVCFGLSLLLSVPLIIIGGLPIAVLIALSLVCGYTYTGGPYPLAYLGLGDLFVLLFFGFAATLSVFYLQTGFLSMPAWIAGAEIGFLSMVMIGVNNLRDVEQDVKAYKKTLPVRFGKTFGRIEITLLIFLPFLLNLYWFYLGFKYAALLPFSTFPIGAALVRGIWTHEPGVIFNHFLGQSALLHIFFGTMLTIGLVLG